MLTRNILRILLFILFLPLFSNVQVRALETTNIIQPSTSHTFSIFISCVRVYEDRYTATFGYTSTVTELTKLEKSNISPTSLPQSSPIEFEPGRVDFAFNVSAPLNQNIVWTVSLSGRTKTSTASSSYPRICTEKPLQFDEDLSQEPIKGNWKLKEILSKDIPHTPQRLIVSFEDNDEGRRAKSLVHRLISPDAVIISENDIASTIIAPSFNYSQNQFSPEYKSAMIQINNTKGVRYAEPDYTYEPHFLPNDPEFSKQWNLTNRGDQVGFVFGSDIKAEQAWNFTQGSPDTVIAIIDSGFDYNHQDLMNSYLRKPDGSIYGFNGSNYSSDATAPGEMSNHGTQVAGVVGAQINNSYGIAGVCGNCKIMPIRAGDSFGLLNNNSIVNGIIFAYDNGADIINMSFGGYVPSISIQEAINNALQKDITLIASAGNDDTSTPQYPASFPGVISVAATGPNDVITSYSEHGNFVDISAPGGDPQIPSGGIISTSPNNQFEYVVGTSFASPAVAGIAGLIKSQNPQFSNNEIQSILIQSADNITSLNQKKLANGLVYRANAQNAMIYASSFQPGFITPNPPIIDSVIIPTNPTLNRKIPISFTISSPQSEIIDVSVSFIFDSGQVEEFNFSSLKEFDQDKVNDTNTLFQFSGILIARGDGVTTIKISAKNTQNLTNEYLNTISLVSPTIKPQITSTTPSLGEQFVTTQGRPKTFQVTLSDPQNTFERFYFSIKGTDNQGNFRQYGDDSFYFKQNVYDGVNHTLTAINDQIQPGSYTFVITIEHILMTSPNRSSIQTIVSEVPFSGLTNTPPQATVSTDSTSYISRFSEQLSFVPTQINVNVSVTEIDRDTPIKGIIIQSVAPDLSPKGFLQLLHVPENTFSYVDQVKYYIGIPGDYRIMLVVNDGISETVTYSEVFSVINQFYCSNSATDYPSCVQCPAGFTLSGTSCVPTPPQPIQCPPNQFLIDGGCQLGGTILVNVWEDENEDGFKQRGETGIKGVLVELYQFGQLERVTSVRTDPNGNAVFRNVEPGKYQIKIVKTRNFRYTFTRFNRTKNRERFDSDVRGNGKSVWFDVEPRERVVDIDAGLKKL